MTIILAIIAFAYVLFACMVFAGNLKSTNNKLAKATNHFKIDVFVPFKNEGENLNTFLCSLNSQSLSAANFQVYFINDHSTDGGEKIIKDAMFNQQNIHLLQNSRKGKKHALLTAFEQSQNEIIVLTDADTELHHDFLSFHKKAYDDELDMVIGSLEMLPLKQGPFHQLQVLEYHTISAITTGMAAWQRPVLCSAANLSFRRSSVKNIKAALNFRYDSGDDMFLLQHFRQLKKRIGLPLSPQPLVTINSEPAKHFLSQRIRWAGKSIGFKDPNIVAYGLTVLLMNLGIITLAILTIIQADILNSFIILYMIKLFADTLIVVPTLKVKKQKLLIYLIPLSTVYPIYAIAVSFIGFIRAKIASIKA